MKEGLAIISQPSGYYYPYVHICWLKHVDGFEWELHGARIIRRFGSNVALTVLAAKGPQAGTQLLAAAKEPEGAFRPAIRRYIPADIKAWERECPCPESWKHATGKE